jgi:putative addiction module component (TIGR02574 family)
MKSDLSKILEAALKLPVEARAAIAGSLIESLDEEVDENVEEAWAEEIARRVQALDSGKAKTIPWSKAPPTDPLTVDGFERSSAPRRGLGRGTGRLTSGTRSEVHLPRRVSSMNSTMPSNIPRGRVLISFRNTSLRHETVAVHGDLSRPRKDYRDSSRSTWSSETWLLEKENQTLTGPRVDQPTRRCSRPLKSAATDRQNR